MALLLCLAFAIFSLKLFNPPQAVPATAPKEVFSAERAMQQLQVIAKEPIVWVLLRMTKSLLI